MERTAVVTDSSEGYASRDDIELIGTSIQLPNGVAVRNRLVKPAMEEGIAHRGGLPGPKHRRLYHRWAQGGWGIIVTGNVQVDPRHLATPHDLSYPDASPETIAAYSMLASAVHSSAPSPSSTSTATNGGAESGDPSLAIVQLSHPGLQSSSTLSFSRWPWVPTVAPIASRPDLGPGLLSWLISRFLWPRKSRTLSPEEWLGIAERFVSAAKGMEDAGWDGVQIHAAHGYLLVEFLSPLTNPSPSPLPGAPAEVTERLHLLWLILSGIRKATNPRFVVSVKINSSDFVRGGLDEKQSAELVKEIVGWKMVDILEISGGTYTSPVFAAPETTTAPPGSRQSLFAHFTTSLLPSIPPPPEGPAIILTGGLHDRTMIAQSLRDRACDLVGIGRPSCLHPELPSEIILNRAVNDEQTRVGGYGIRGAGLIKFILKWSTPSKPKRRNHLAQTDSNGTGPSNEDGTAKAGHREVGGEGIPLVDAGISTFWHEFQLCRLGRGVDADPNLHWIWGGLVTERLWWGLLGGGPLHWFKNDHA